MKDANYAPMYCALYPQMTEIARKHGYAMAVHGTLGRDMDLICIPWVESPSEPAAVVDEITSTFHIRKVGEPDTTFHGRERWTVTVGFGECFLDLQFMPRVAAAPAASVPVQAVTLTDEGIVNKANAYGHPADGLFVGFLKDDLLAFVKDIRGEK